MERNLVLGSYVNIDRAMVEPNLDRVDVIIPVKNTKDNWEDCLGSFYREIPIDRLLIGDGGSIDDTIKIVRKYPRVTVFDQSKLNLLGYRIKCLIEEVETEWFVYLHSDVSLPKGWYEEMCKYRGRWDWFECRRIAVYPDGKQQELTGQYKKSRAYSGSQMGKTAVLKKAVEPIQDDYIYRTEDIIIKQYVESLGYKYGKVPTTFHYHHVVPHTRTKDEQVKLAIQSAKATIKYLRPTRENIVYVYRNIQKLSELGVYHKDEWKDWVQKTSPDWSKWIAVFRLWELTMKNIIKVGKAILQR